MSGRVLIIDDDPTWGRLLEMQVRDAGLDVDRAMFLEQGLGMLEEKRFDVVFLDVSLPDGCGLDVLPQVQAAPGKPEVIIVTGEGSKDGAELAVRCGAWTYLEKSGAPAEITLNLERALQYRRQRRDAKPVSLRREGLIGRSVSFTACLDRVAEASQSDTSVLIQGETGTGKEVIAAAIHANSPRASRSFVIVDCASIPQNLAEAILFGHAKGAYTGADRNAEGLVMQASGGTLFLDEVGELPLSVQKTFLRVLQERTFRQVGGSKEIAVDFRLVAATNRDLLAMSQGGDFRSDLYYRIEAFRIDVPPLRARQEDIKPIAEYHLKRACDRQGIVTKAVSPDFYEALEDYGWPGNVRELVNAVGTAITRGLNDEMIFARHLPDEIRANVVRKSVRGIYGDLPSDGLPTFKSFRAEMIAQAEKWYFSEVVRRAGGSVAKGMEISGLAKSRFFQLLREHGLSISDAELS